LPINEPCCRLHELERVQDLSVKVIARLQLAVSEECK
jgi:hypothetical protein